MSFGFGYSSTPPADFNEDGSRCSFDIVLRLQHIINNNLVSLVYG